MVILKILSYDMNAIRGDFTEMNEVIISIIIPVYNAENFIDHCLASVLEQTFTQYEVILVDDGSTDNSGEICDHYATKDARIYVIHKENGGVSSARNIGLEKANGKYIAFIDIDDVLDPKYLEVLYTNAVVHDADISCCDCIEISKSYDGERTNRFKNVNDKRMISDSRDLFYDYFAKKEFYGYVVWGKIIKKSLAVSEKMESMKYGEDTQYMMKLFQHNPKVYLDDYKGYYYVRWDESATKSVDVLEVQRLKDDFILSSFILESCFKSEDDKLIKFAAGDYIKLIYTRLSQIIKSKDRNKYNAVRNILLDNINKALKLKSISCKHRIMFLLYKLNPDLYWNFISSILKGKNKKKAIIVTIYDPKPNYGNRLQNYAVQTVLESLGVKTETISAEKSMVSEKEKLKYYIQRLFKYRLPGNKTFWKAIFPRLLVFDRFNRHYINTKHIDQIDQIDEADYYVLGSDQVWNATWYDKESIKKDLFLLTFARPEQKVCFSPSFGIDTLPTEWIPWFKHKLKSFPFLSVREEAGKILIWELTGKEAEILIDPTMMLDKVKWMKIAKKPMKLNLNTPYILTYFLGGRSDRINNDLNRIAKENGFNIYNLLDETQQGVYVSGPCEFIYLISQAKLVLTDSFHACVFSFLFQKPFLVYSRQGKENNMMSRIETLLKKFNLERKYVDSGLENELLEADYSDGYKQLIIERQKTMTFLKKSMNLQ